MNKFHNFVIESVRIWRSAEAIMYEATGVRQGIIRIILLIACCVAQIGFGQPTNPSVNIRAWGDNYYGNRNIPFDLTNAVAIAAGYEHSLALTANRTVRAWGRNTYGQCNVPADLTNVVAISAGERHNLALQADGNVRMWGENNFGQLNIPAGLSNVVAISAGMWHSLALRADGKVFAWGYNVHGQCNVPADLTNVAALSAGYYHSLALLANGTVRAWTQNDYGQCSVPPEATNVTAIAILDYSSIALKADGTVVQWGQVCGSGCIMPGWTNIVSISAHYQHVLAITSEGSVLASGGNSWGQCDVPADLPRATAVSAGYAHSLALHAGPEPTILRSPLSRTAIIGSAVNFSPIVVGSPPLRYQWYFGANLIPGATNAVLALADLHPSQAGTYSVTVTNDTGSATSEPASLSVLPGLEICLVPAITLKGEVGLTYRLEYVNAVGPTNAWHPIETLLITNNPQFYFDFSSLGQPQRFYRLVQLP